MSLLSKLSTRELLIAIRAQYKNSGIRVGFTSGVFDILHAGHVEYLNAAKSLCDKLIVAVNSNSSVKTIKGPTRPINSEQDRMIVVAGLESVDHVFIFDESNNNQNISLLQPDIYCKAGDYSKDKLSSATIVESYGGKVQFVPFKEGRSSSRIIEQIGNSILDTTTSSISIKQSKRERVVFLDRDGTLIEHINYLHEPEKVKLIPGVEKALKALNDAGFGLVIVTNQPGIGVGYFTKEDFFNVNRVVLRALGKTGATIDKIYFCPHSFAEKCECRKPGTALPMRAQEELGVDFSKSFFVGDMTGDIECGKRLGCKTILVETGEGGKDNLFSVQPNFNVKSVADIVDIIL